MKFSFECYTKEIDLCSDSTNVNIALHRLLRGEMGERYLLVQYPAYKHELALADAFKECDKDNFDIYYLP